MDDTTTRRHTNRSSSFEAKEEAARWKPSGQRISCANLQWNGLHPDLGMCSSLDEFTHCVALKLDDIIPYFLCNALNRKPRQVLDPSIANEPQEWKKKPRKKANK